MTTTTSKGAQRLTFAIGLTCLASAAWLARDPRRATRTLRLPQSEGLGRSLAARDFAVGVLLLAPPTRHAALTLRAASDAFDAGLMTSELLRDRARASTGLLLLGALALSGLGWSLRSHV